MFCLRRFVVGAACLFVCFCVTSSTLPEFLENMKNITTVVGSDVQFTCSIKNLGNHKVAWYHLEKKQVIAVHKQRVSSNRRYQLYHSYPSHWVLKIRGVRLTDEGRYMCQINTVPMTTLIGYLKVQVPPDIIDSQTSSDVEAEEGSNVTLACKAFGIPVPKIVWKREDSKKIILSDRFGKRYSVKEYPEEKLNFHGVNREHMGAYLCIASNGVPPSISRRISLSINFPPVLSIKNQLIGTPVNSQVSLTCIVQSHPKSIIYWTNSTSSMIGNTATYKTKISKKSYNYESILTINNVQPEHFGTYLCKAENPYGDADGSVRLYELQQVSDSRNRLGVEDQSGNERLTDWTEQAMSVIEDYRESSSSSIDLKSKLLSIQVITMIVVVYQMVS